MNSTKKELKQKMKSNQIITGTRIFFIKGDIPQRMQKYLNKDEIKQNITLRKIWKSVKCEIKQRLKDYKGYQGNQD